MLGGLAQVFKIPDLRRRIFFTLAMFMIFRIGAHIPVPGVDPNRIQFLFQAGSLFGLLDVIAGGAMSAVSVFAMGIMPYINASIIMQLLTVVVPTFEEWSKEGEEGRKKITQVTRYGTVGLALIQGLGTAVVLSRNDAVLSPGIGSSLLIALTLTAGTTFLMWLGEQITEHGIGNGISLIIFAGIVSRLPDGVLNVIQLLQFGFLSWWNVILLALLGLAVIVAVIWIQEGQRRIPVQYSKRVVGRRMYGGQSTHIPIRVNMAGVIPVIFASSILALPPTLAAFIDRPWAQRLAEIFSFGTALHTVLYALLIIFFTYFYTAIQFNPADVADNIRKNGGYIPGIRPGRPTAEYLDRVIIRLTLFGALFLAFIATMPVFFGRLVDIPGLFFGGTALLIVVGVALETMKQIEAHLLMRHYEGFMKR
ncbi:MAG TPA: preprotein translocase subunit SecY [Sphingobacteriaceae bacterium]|nr:preprotein translocase subunit SecY [Sphingobacteriaceae bacterium]